MRKIKFPITCFSAVLLFLLNILSCENNNPANINETKEQSIQFSLEVQGRDTASFSGQPVKALIVLKDKINFSELAWNTGAGSISVPDSIIGKTAKSFEIDLIWKSYPAKMDLQDKCFYDTIFVSIGGGYQTSNKVLVKVTNLPVVMDSIRIGDTFYNEIKKVLRYRFDEGSKDVSLQFFARDLDQKTPDITFAGNFKGLLEQLNPQSPLELLYSVPAEEFDDTITFLIYDHEGSQVFSSLILFRDHNNPPVIDSISVQDQILKGTQSIYKFALPAFIQLDLQAFAHDFNGTVSRFSWKAIRPGSLRWDSIGTDRAQYYCQACGQDTLRDTSVIVDTVTLTAFDNRGDSTSCRMVILKGELNNPPVLSMISINDTVLELQDTIINYQASGPCAYDIKLHASDPDSNELTVLWSGVASSRLSSISDSGVIYTTAASLGRDTLVISISDRQLTTRQKIVFQIADLIPVFDSLLVGNLHFTDEASLYFYTTTPGDSFLVSIYMRDFDKKDTVKYIWSANDPEIISTSLGNRAKIVLPNNVYRDTIVVTIQDGTFTTKKLLSVDAANQ